MPESPVFTLEQLTGRTRDHLTELADPRCSLHREVVGPYLAMRAAAAADGIDLAAFSSFRDFDRQLAIWNGKFRGERPMQDRAGRALDAADPATGRTGDRHPLVVSPAGGQPAPLGNRLRRHGSGRCCRRVTACRWFRRNTGPGGRSSA